MYFHTACKCINQKAWAFLRAPRVLFGNYYRSCFILGYLATAREVMNLVLNSVTPAHILDTGSCLPVLASWTSLDKYVVSNQLLVIYDEMVTAVLDKSMTSQRSVMRKGAWASLVGCRSLSQRNGHLEWLQCVFTFNQTQRPVLQIM